MGGKAQTSRNEIKRSETWLRIKMNKAFLNLAARKVFRTLSVMEVQFTPELEARLARSAPQQGRNPVELAKQVMARYFDEESRFIDAVNRGEQPLLHCTASTSHMSKSTSFP
jgi:hypothetical protein